MTANKSFNRPRLRCAACLKRYLDMRLHVLLISLLFSSMCVAHESISKNDLVGKWDSHDRSEEWIPSMVVTEAGEITFTQTTIHSSGHELRIECKSDMSKVQFIEGVFIIPCMQGKTTTSYKLVFSGWASAVWAKDRVTKIVGTLYTLSYGTPQKGEPIAMERRGDTVNKSFNTDASDAGAG